jgi:hypothetical protein
LFGGQQLRGALKQAFARFGWIGRRLFFLGRLLLSSVTSFENDSVFNHRGTQRLECWGSCPDFKDEVNTGSGSERVKPTALIEIAGIVTRSLPLPVLTP